MKTRSDALREIESRSFDVCIIGAGATGAGCALDAQLRGFRTVLVDAGDFASGSSSASTKLAHGGVRYLQQAFTQCDVGQLKVVRQALQERILMIENAPHLAHAREFVVPCFNRFQMLYYGIGVKLYDWFAGKATLGASRLLSREQASQFPLQRDHLAGAVTYLDGQFDDARYGITLVKTFADAGGVVANYLKVVDLEKNNNGTLSAAIAQDGLNSRTLNVRARVFVNAAGPFSDKLRFLAAPNAPNRLVLSKGVHILLPLDDGVRSALLIPRTEDGRVIFAIPWLGRLLVGTTDQEITQDQEMVVTREEAEYLLRHLNRYTARPYQIEEIVSAFAGVRPLVRSKQAHATRDLIREHEVEIDEGSGLVSILGGKWTTYRAMAEDTIDAVEDVLGVRRTQASTRHHRLSGSEGYTSDQWKALASQHGLAEATARHLSEKFGNEAFTVAAIADNPELKMLLISGAPWIQAEVVYCARHEMAVTIEDVLARRIGLQFFSWKMAIEAAPVVAQHLARELGWTEQQKQQAIHDYIDKIEHALEAIGLRRN